MDPFRQLQALGLLVMALAIAPAAVPPLRPWRGRLLVAAIVIYAAGAAVILARWQLAGG